MLSTLKQQQCQIRKYKKLYEQRRVQIIKSIYYSVPFEKKWKILDVGGGIGFYADVLKQYTTNITSIDINQENVFICRNKGYKALICNLDEGLLFGDSTFDFINALEIIEHLISPIFFLEEMKRILKNDKYLLISTPNRNSLEGLKGKVVEKLTGKIWKAWDDTHKYIFSYDELVKVIKAHFEIITCMGYYFGFTIKGNHFPPILWGIKSQSNLFRKFGYLTVVLARNKK